MFAPLRFGTVIAFLAFMFSSTGPASACSCFAPTPEDELRDRTLIATGRVEAYDGTAEVAACRATWDEMRDKCGPDAEVECRAPYLEKLATCSGEYRAHLRLETVWKGAAAPEKIVIGYDIDSGMCGLDIKPGDQLFVAGDLIDGRFLAVGACNSGPTEWLSLGEENARLALSVWEPYRRAWERLAQSARSAASDPKPWRELANFLDRNNDPDGALAALQHLSEIAPNDAAAAVDYARLISTHGDYVKAVTAWRHALSLAPADADVQRNLARARLLARDGVDPAEVDFTNLDLNNIRLDGANLRGKRFSGSHLEEVSFQKAHLEGAVFTDAELDQVDFSGAYLRGADFSAGKRAPGQLPLSYDAKSFVGADLAGARFAGAGIYISSIYEDAPLAENVAAANLAGATLSCANLTGETLSPHIASEREAIWGRHMADMSLLKRLVATQSGAKLGSDCAKTVAAYLALPSDCRPWSDARNLPYCRLPD